MSPDEILAALRDFDTGWMLTGRELPGLGSLRIMGSVRSTGFEFRAVSRWTHAYEPWVLGTVTPARDGSRIRVIIRPSVLRILSLGVVHVGFAILNPWFAMVAAIASHAGSISLGFRPAVEQLEDRLRDLIDGRWERR
jgi:hypothetical protein